ncbi:MAG: hypothetical protein IIY98_02030 [Aeriscardovia sp.]|nr:hypothetical protein [Aeriscardovia sp.]
MNLRPFHNCPLELLPRWLLSLASICLVIEACFQIAARVRLHLVCETVNMTLLGLLVLCGWFFVLFDKPKAARACYLAYAIELFTDAFVMYFYHTHFYSPSHFFLQVSLSLIIMAFCKQRYAGEEPAKKKGTGAAHGSHRNSR